MTTETESKLTEAIAALKPFLDNPPIDHIGCKQEWLENLIIGAEMVAHQARIAECELVEREGVARRGGNL